MELIVGDVGDAERRRPRARRRRRVVHLAAAVGVGQSMYEIARYTELNTMATARFLERVVAQRPMPTRLVVASSMSIYGEGEYVCDEHGASRPGPRPEEQLLARQWEWPARRAAQPLRPVGTSENKPLIPTSIYAITKRDHEEMCLVTGAAYGIPTVALRFFNVYGAGQALSNPYTGVAAIFASRLLNGRPPVIFEDGAQSRDFTHVSDIVQRHPARARVRRAPRPRGQPRHRPPDDRRRGRRVISRGHGPRHRARAQRAVPRRRHPPLLRGPDRARELLGLRGRKTLRGRHGRADRVARRIRTPTTASTTPPTNSRPGAWPAEGDVTRTATDAPIWRSSSSRPTRRSWLEPCLRTVFAHAGDACLDVVVVDNESTDGTRELVESRFPQARVVASANRGFSHANNRGAMTCDARYVLFLNPDTEIVDGTFGELVATLDARPEVGLAGVASSPPTARSGRRSATSRASRGRSGEALASERWPVRPALGRRARARHGASTTAKSTCDWTSGSFMLARREALLSAGLMDERFFIYSEEPDLCLRMKRAGWDDPPPAAMTIVHHAGKGGVRPKMVAQDAYTRRQYAAQALRAATACRVPGCGRHRGTRCARAARAGRAAPQRRAASRLALRTLTGRESPPFGAPPATAITRP